ncbi:MAG: carbohydrate binding domain-containing protein, partial [Tepidisphaerales bacterium]
GVNIAFAGCFPKHDDADAVAKRLAHFGFNAVRLHHMDMQPYPNGIFADGKLETLSPEALERLDYFISALKREGIYSNINLHVSRWYSKAHNWPGADRTESFDKIVDIFYPELIAVQKKYARDLLGHVNAYTKLRYADDPAVAIVEINNENSIFMWGSDQHLGELPEPFAAELKKQWNAWLVSQYTSRDKLATAWNAGLEKDGPNLVTDPNCETLGKPGSNWATEMHNGAKMTLIRDDGGVKLTVPAAVDPAWHLQFNCVPVSLKKGQVYAVRFLARADKPGARLTVGTQQAHEPYETMGLSGGLDLTADWQEYQLGFKAAKDDDRVKLNFCSAYQPASVWIKNVQLFSGGQVGLRTDEDPAAGSVAVCKKGQPFASLRLRDWHRFLQEIDEKYFVGMYSFLKKDLGVKCAVTGTIAYGPLGTIGQAKMDFVDQHSYWEHPHFPRRQWDMNDWVINNKPMSDSPQGSTMAGLVTTRVLGKPYTVTEYQHSAPNEWQAECMPMIATIAAAQDWDGVFIFAYSHNQNYKKQRMELLRHRRQPGEDGSLAAGRPAVPRRRGAAAGGAHRHPPRRHAIPR